MQDMIQSMTTFMELRGFAKSTQRTYLAHVQRFCDFCGKPPASVGYDEVRAFLHHAIKTRKCSAEYVNSPTVPSSFCINPYYTANGTCR